MKIKWYGHAAFKITTDSGLRIIIDPYRPGGGLSYGKITDEADIVLTSHDHDDHNYVNDIQGAFVHINTKGDHEAKGIRIKAVPCFHDPSKGRERGKNLIFAIEADGLRIVHMGDLGHALDTTLIGELGAVDVMFLPVGGFYTIDSSEAGTVMSDVKPSITIPMHYKTEKCDYPITGIENFIRGKEKVKKTGLTEITIDRKSLPSTPEIIVLDYAL